MNFSVYIASRLQLKPADGRRSPGVTIAVTGMAVAVAVMILTLSVVTGFKKSITEKVVGYFSQISVTALPSTDENGLTDPASTLFRCDSTIVNAVHEALGDDVTMRAAITATTILKTDSAFVGLTLMGWLPDDDFPFIRENIVEGYLPDYSSDTTLNQAVISQTTARELSLELGDRVYAYFFTDGNLRARRLTVAGIYDTMFGERDRMMTVCSPALLQGIYGVDSLTVNNLMIDGIPADAIAGDAQKLQMRLIREYYAGAVPCALQVVTVETLGAQYFSWLELLDTNVWVIIILMTVVASFTLVSSLFILILERVRTIGLLKSLGAANSQIQRIFLLLAMKIVLWGMGVGNILAIALILLQSHFHLLPLDPEAYYLDHVPMEFNILHLIAVDLGTLLIAWLVMVFPSMIIATISPSRTIRYE
ncbi:MAG: ABC transporter permease [Muribaculaceae bacterium]|nr:ABC transporter permease [Muribaculaceae bacterium]